MIWEAADASEILPRCLETPPEVLVTDVRMPPGNSDDGLRAALADAHRRYSRLVNFREGWRGYLWQGRFASVVMDEAHLIAPDERARLNERLRALYNSNGPQVVVATIPRVTMGSIAEDAIARAAASMDDPDAIYQANIALLQGMGKDAIAKRLAAAGHRPSAQHL